MSADSSFSKVIEKTPDYALGYYWKANSLRGIDPTDKSLSVKLNYEKTFELIKPEERSLPQNKKVLLEVCKYLAVKDIEKAKQYYTVVQELDINDSQAKAFFSKLKEK